MSEDNIQHIDEVYDSSYNENVAPKAEEEVMSLDKDSATSIENRLIHNDEVVEVHDDDDVNTHVIPHNSEEFLEDEKNSEEVIQSYELDLKELTVSENLNETANKEVEENEETHEEIVHVASIVEEDVAEVVDNNEEEVQNEVAEFVDNNKEEVQDEVGEVVDDNEEEVEDKVAEFVDNNKEEVQDELGEVVDDNKEEVEDEVAEIVDNNKEDVEEVLQNSEIKSIELKDIEIAPEVKFSDNIPTDQIIYKQDNNKGEIKNLSSKFSSDGDTKKDCCFSCGKIVYHLERIVEKEHVYHKGCFKCSKCQRPLQLNNFSVEDNQLFCGQHYKENFVLRGGKYDGDINLLTDMSEITSQYDEKGNEDVKYSTKERTELYTQSISAKTKIVSSVVKADELPPENTAKNLKKIYQGKNVDKKSENEPKPLIDLNRDTSSQGQSVCENEPEQLSDDVVRSNDPIHDSRPKEGTTKQLTQMFSRKGEQTNGLKFADASQDDKPEAGTTKNLVKLFSKEQNGHSEIIQ